MGKNICMIAYTNYPSDNRVRREADALAVIPDYTVVVFVPKEKELPETYRLCGVEIRELDISKYQGKSTKSYLFSYLTFMIAAFFAINKLLIQKSIDIVHVHNMPNFIILSAIIPFLFRKKIVLDVHDTMIETYTVKFPDSGKTVFYKLILWALRLEEYASCALAHRIVCVNHVQQTALVRRGIPERKILVSMNVPDPKIFSSPVKDHPIRESHGTFRLVYHGSLVKRLGIDLTIRAVAMASSEIPGLEFHIIGNGDDMAEFMDVSREVGAQGRVKFRGKVPLQDISAIVQEMDLGVVSNRNNIATELMLPVKMLEYMALGIPVVVPRLKTIGYYFTDESVFYFEPDNLQSLYQAILDAYRNRTLRLEKATRAKDFFDLYGWDRHKEDFLNMYKALLHKD